MYRKKHSVYIYIYMGFGTIYSFRHPSGVLERIPEDKGGLLYYFLSPYILYSLVGNCLLLSIQVFMLSLGAHPGDRACSSFLYLLLLIL